MNNKIDITKIIKMAVDETDHPFSDEEDLRIAVVQKIQTSLKKLHPLVIAEYKYISEDNTTNKIDIYLCVNNQDYVIELKYRPNCTKRNKTRRDGVLVLQGNNKGISVEWQIDKLCNHSHEISVSNDSNEYGAIISWRKGDQIRKYYIKSQYLAYECVDDINKLQYFVKKVNNKAIAYAVVLSDQSWPEINGHIDLEDGVQTNRKQIKDYRIQTNKGISISQEKIDIDVNTPHQGYWLKISKIKNNK